MNRKLFDRVIRWVYTHNGFTWSELRQDLNLSEGENRYTVELFRKGTDPFVTNFGDELKEEETVFYLTRSGIQTAANHLAQEGATRISRWALLVSLIATVPAFTKAVNVICGILRI